MDRLEIFEAQADEIRKQFGVVKGGLEAMPGVTVFPSAANFFLVRVPDANRAFEGLRSRGVLVRNFNGAHPLMENCLRITVGTPEENRRLLTALREAL